MELSAHLIAYFSGKGYDVIDHGPAKYDPWDDYPAFCISAALAVVSEQQAGILALGVVLGGSGNGEQIAANKVIGARAALAWNQPTAILAREHNDANIVAIGGRQHTTEEAATIVEAFLQGTFSNDQRHIRRIAQIASYEAQS